MALPTSKRRFLLQMGQFLEGPSFQNWKISGELTHAHYRSEDMSDIKGRKLTVHYESLEGPSSLYVYRKGFSKVRSLSIMTKNKPFLN
jgi:hypothetical protein